ncbi:MAG: ATP-binding cassette domain-containing protein, partial [Candidatus Methylarchaceae archaeon HK01M]|nr:ATP-binding cassette domain-containing protein [Candidatus Methylarchaceae archaeon HK01M]
SNLSFALRLRKYLRSKIRSIVEGVAEQVGIEKHLFPRKPKELSAGQQQKVAVGRAVTIPPKVLLMDEIRRLHRELGTTTVYVTHNLVEAMTLADRIAVMNKGSIEQVDTPIRIYKHPVNDFVADFIRYFDFSYQLAKRKMLNHV